MKITEGRQRVVIEHVTPEIDAGRYPIKRTPGEVVQVEADVFTDGHDSVTAILLHRSTTNKQYTVTEMTPLVNDRWRAEFKVEEIGRHKYTIWAWVDHFKTWTRDLAKRIEAGQDVSVDRIIGAEFVEEAVARADERHAETLKSFAEGLRDTDRPIRQVLTPQLTRLMAAYPDRRFATKYERELEVTVDRERARFSAWYELFPRSWPTEPGRHGTLRDVIEHLPYVSELGFDVLYLPPIHPIGETHRKGINNTVVAEPDDVGSPWAIGGPEGGHKSIHPDLGTFEDFDALVKAAGVHGMEIALDVAFQCSPDHPYVKEHPEWFKKRPDGTIQYAENPPKKYQDIYPFDFETDNWAELWDELKGVFDFWIERGVRVFRVDNPHTKPFRFWEWVITSIQTNHPDVIFLSEAFTRPRVMYNLAKRGFTQSYNYFAWRNTSWELREYFTELTTTEVAEYLRPNLWPNTPDILTEYLQHGGRPAFLIRLILASTLGASYGIYGPAFELGENEPLEYGKEEYFHSEKYEIRSWDLEAQHSLRRIIAQVNQIRRSNPALQTNTGLQFHDIENDQLLAYSKVSEDDSNLMLMVVNLDPHHTQSGWVGLPLEDLGIDPTESYQVHDLIGGGRYLWSGTHNYVELNPHAMPAHIFRVRRRLRREHDFDYFA